MLIFDATGSPVSCANGRVLELFDQALGQFHSYFDDPVETIDQALAEQPDFIMGHLFRASMFAMLMERKFEGEIDHSLAVVHQHLGRANRRELGHLEALNHFRSGYFKLASDAWERVVTDYPRDSFALQCGHLMDFYLGDAVNLRDRIARVLPHYDEYHRSYSYLLGMQAFGFEECNQFDRAEQTARRALAIEPRDPWAIHAMAHVMEMQNRYDEGIEWYNQRESDWAPDNGFAYHNWWHLTLYLMERAEYERALSIFDQYIYPGEAEFVLGLVDATAFLWRLHLQGVDVGERWRPIAAQWREQQDTEGGYYAFNDWHAMMAYAATGDERAGQDLLARMQATASVAPSDTVMPGQVGNAVANAVWAFGCGQYSDAIELLMPVRSIANRFGGSNAQRDALNQTLIVAAIRANETTLASNLLNERLAHKPESPLAWRFKTHAANSAGDSSTEARCNQLAESLVKPRSARQAA